MEPPPPPSTTTTTIPPNETLNPDQKTYHLKPISTTLQIRQFPTLGISFQLWPSSSTLISFLSSPTFLPLPPHPRILELGSGTGLVGIAAAALLHATVTVTDLPHVLPNLHFNVAANAETVALHGGKVDVAALRWGEAEDMEVFGGKEFDLILGSDLVYHENLYEVLVETLKGLIVGKEVVFLMAHLKRWKKEGLFFRKVRRFFDVEVVFNEGPGGGERVGVVVYRFVCKRAGRRLKAEIVEGVDSVGNVICNDDVS